MTSLQELKRLSFDELQERADLGELNFAELAEMCRDELYVYVELLDDFHSLLSTGTPRSERHRITPHPFVPGALIIEDGSWREHHNAMEQLLSLAWHAGTGAGQIRKGGARSFLRFLDAFQQYHRGWRREVLEPIEQQLNEALKSGENPLLSQTKSLLEQAKDSYLRFLDLKDIGDGLVEDFFDESRCAQRRQAELERRNADLEKALRIEQQKRHSENPFSLPLGAQNFELKEIEAAARQNGFERGLRQLRKHLANWKADDREKGERWQLERAELEEFLRYLSQKQRTKP